MTALMTAHKVHTFLRTGTTCTRCGYWAQAVECQREAETGERCALPATWAPPTGEPRVLIIDGEVAVPDFKRFHEAEVYFDAMVAIADKVAPRKVKPRKVAKPELTGLAAWRVEHPNELEHAAAEQIHWKARRAAGQVPFKPWTAEQESRWHGKTADKVAAYVALGYSVEWAKWYCGPLAEAHQARKAMTRKDEYALYVSSGSGPALDKLAKKLSPAKKR